MFYKYNTVPVYIGIVRYSTVLWSVEYQESSDNAMPAFSSVQISSCVYQYSDVCRRAGQVGQLSGDGEGEEEEGAGDGE